MSPVMAISGETEILVRWAGLLEHAGRACTLVRPEQLRGTSLAGTLCLYDLGPRGGMDPQQLIDAARTYPDAVIVAASARPGADEGLQLLRNGIRGYCNRLASARLLSALLATVEAGEIWAGREVTDFLLHSRLSGETEPRRGGEELIGRLTAREAEIARQVAAGRSNKVIAADSGISERTVKAHLNSIFRKTGVSNRVQLALAIAQGTEPRRRSSG